MYVPEFWVGVGATVIAEIVALFIWAFILSLKNGRRK